MEHLWATWRAKHVMTFSGDPKMEGKTLFQRLAECSDDEEALIVYRGTHVFVLLNRFPYTSGHVMIIPFRPVRWFTELSPEEQQEMTTVLDSVLRWLTHAYAPQGFNVGMNLGEAGGAGLPDHLHMHVVPRWAGDTNFMTAVSHTRILPEDLSTTWKRIKAESDRDSA